MHLDCDISVAVNTMWIRDAIGSKAGKVSLAFTVQTGRRKSLHSSDDKKALRVVSSNANASDRSMVEKNLQIPMPMAP